MPPQAGPSGRLGHSHRAALGASSTTGRRRCADFSQGRVGCTCTMVLGCFVRELLACCASQAPFPLYNTCKQKLLDGQQVFSYTIDKLDVELYLEVR